MCTSFIHSLCVSLARLHIKLKPQIEIGFTASCECVRCLLFFDDVVSFLSFLVYNEFFFAYICMATVNIYVQNSWHM